MTIKFYKGQKINNLVIVEKVEKDKHGRNQYLCKCLLCGNDTIEKATNINTNKKTSCGCDTKDKISKSKTKHNGKKDYPSEYRSWLSMKTRCNNKNYHAYHRYGGRGVTFCKRWNNFENFLKDLGEKPFKNAQLDRIDNDGNYCPENCRWVTAKENSNNRKKYKSNSGYTGIHLNKHGKYQVSIVVNRKSIHIGTTDNLEDAVNIRKEFIIKYNKVNNTKLKYEELSSNDIV